MRPGKLACVAWLLIAASLSAQKIGEVERLAPSSKAPREKTLEWTAESGQPFWYRLPKELSERRPPALIFLLHGTGMNHGWGFWNYGVDAGHFRSEDIVVSPEGCTPGQGTSFNFVQGKKDGDQIQQLIQLFKKAFPIGNVYLYGHSQGAFFTYWFAGEYPESINGIVAHAGNALNPQFPKLAQERVAIAILHGEVDQVVSVDAAYRSEKLYREAGYKNLKLRVVPNLRPEAGHWPLPDEVKTLLEWCDQVCVSSADGALLVAEAELAKQAPSASVICDAIERADQLLKQERGATKSALEERLTRCRNFSALLLGQWQNRC
jgi:predicted esterase